MECVKERRCYSFSHCAVLGILAEHNCHLKDRMHFDNNGPWSSKDCKTTYFRQCKSQGVCDPGYNICSNCCDLNDDCECDESCDRNQAPNKKMSYRPENSSYKYRNYSEN